MRRTARRAAHLLEPKLPRDAAGIAAAPTPAAILARGHDALVRAAPFDLLRALAAHDHTLERAYLVARKAASDNRRIEPAADWLIDNVYLIRNRIREVRESLS
ncbi:MAG TPA: hypothetical protein VFL63_02250, partial [Rhodanobacteraceae bacterium]|nr:hypothetical protein [Rhodanobacteraceae bacterium]